MTIHRIRLLGDPILRARCEPITKPKSTAVRVILDDMRERLCGTGNRAFGSGRGDRGAADRRARCGWSIARWISRGR